VSQRQAGSVVRPEPACFSCGVVGHKSVSWPDKLKATMKKPEEKPRKKDSKHVRKLSKTPGDSQTANTVEEKIGDTTTSLPPP